RIEVDEPGALAVDEQLPRVVVAVRDGAEGRELAALRCARGGEDALDREREVGERLLQRARQPRAAHAEVVVEGERRAEGIRQAVQREQRAREELEVLGPRLAVLEQALQR